MYGLYDWLTEEAQKAGKIKEEAPIMVVIGNPPYSVSSCNKNKYIEDLISEYKKDLNEKNIQPLSDDYIKFIRLGEHFIEKNKEGILAYITNNSFLDGIIHRNMRKHLMSTFDKIYILNLHGNAKKKECASDGSKDENVFNIQQGVSINIFIKSTNKKTSAEVYCKDVWGLREDKFEYLENNTLKSIDFEKLEPKEPHYFFVPKDFSLNDEYEKGFKINELMKVNSSGIKTQRDDASTAFTEHEADLLKNDFINLSESKLKQKYGFQDVRDWKVLLAKQDLMNNPVIERKILYRPFDYRYANYTGKTKGIMGYPRYEIMKHFIKDGNIALSLCRQLSSADFRHVFISNEIFDICYISSQTKESSYCFPLYLYGDSAMFEGVRRPNLNPDIIRELETCTGLTFTPEIAETADTFSPVDLLDYIYAVLYSNKYREKYKEFLKIDFPRIPYPESKEQFLKLKEFGTQLRKIHLFETPLEITTTYPIQGDNEVKKIEYRDGKVYINDAQYFGNISDTAWNFYIGGYQPAQKWLKDRKNRVLNWEDIIHYQKIITALNKTHDIMQEIDKFYNPQNC